MLDPVELVRRLKATDAVFARANADNFNSLSTVIIRQSPVAVR